MSRTPNFFNLVLVTEQEEFFIYRKDFLVHHYLVSETNAKGTSGYSFKSKQSVDC